MLDRCIVFVTLRFTLTMAYPTSIYTSNSIESRSYRLFVHAYFTRRWGQVLLVNIFVYETIVDFTLAIGDRNAIATRSLLYTQQVCTLVAYT